MPGFVNSPALARLVALQMLDDERQQSRRPRQTRTFRARLAARRTRATAPVKNQRRSPSGRLVEEGR